MMLGLILATIVNLATPVLMVLKFVQIYNAWKLINQELLGIAEAQLAIIVFVLGIKWALARALVFPTARLVLLTRIAPREFAVIMSVLQAVEEVLVWARIVPVRWTIAHRAQQWLLATDVQARAGLPKVAI